jgi:hypothetical protein
LSVISGGVAGAIGAYIRAKDENRPYLMPLAFAGAANLRMVVKSDAISFPTHASGREAITDVLVRDFAQTYENVRTFCLSSPPESVATAFSCDWLVGMSAKETRLVRVGCGRYDWVFGSASPCRAMELTITVEVMQLLPAETLFSVMEWFDQLAYPWCSKRAAFDHAPELEGLDPVRHWLSSDYATPQPDR